METRYTRARRRPAAAVSFLSLLALVSGCREPVSVRESHLALGTIITLELGPVEEEEGDRIIARCWEEADRLEKIFSRYDPDSELNRINREASARPVPVSREMLEVLVRAEEISRLTGGALDITVGPLMEAWGFFPERAGRTPSREEIGSALSRVGWEKVAVDRERGTVGFLVPGMELDLGALAKGYVVDRLAALLAGEGIESALVNAGGDIYALGGHFEGRGWRIGVEHPRREGEVWNVIELRDRAVATSGDYRNYFISRNLRHSHIIDPRTGQTARTGVVESTVLAPDCLTADGLATALFVLGPERALEVLESTGEWEGMVIVEDGDGLAALRTAGFPSPGEN